MNVLQRSTAMLAVMAASADLQAAERATARLRDPMIEVRVEPTPSALGGYVRFEEVARVPWSDVNRAVFDAGGHVGILRDRKTVTPPSTPGVSSATSLPATSPPTSSGSTR